jgi:hypothetical protein
MKSFFWVIGIKLFLMAIIPVQAATIYVDLNCATPTSPYGDWSTAATNIQDAIDTAAAGDVVLVTNGVYATGGKVMFGDLTNRVALDKAITVQSVNGPWFTTIMGNGATNGTAAVRCAWVTNGAELNGFTLTAGATRTSGDQTNLLSGGGALCLSNALLRNCLVISNLSQVFGGGLSQGTAINTAIIGNRSSATGSGAAYAALLNCTVVSNWLSAATFQCRHTNTIVYHNITAANYSGGTFAFSCTTPAPGGIGNITSAPLLFADSVHLTSTSPCRSAGTNLATGLDIDGQAWSNPPSIGCDEWRDEPTIVYQPRIQQSVTPIGFNVSVLVAGQSPFMCYWTRNGTLIENDSHFTQANSTNLVALGISDLDVGDYRVVVSNTFGMTTSAVARLTIRYVDAASPAPAFPYLSWSTAASTIQDAINAAVEGDLVLVTNGVYAAGGRVMAGDLTNRIALTKALAVRSVNGPFVTTIRGNGATNGTAAVRCAWLTNRAMLHGFTLTAGATRTTGDTASLQSGGGVWCASTNALVANCIIRSNTAVSYGSGFFQGRLQNSYVLGNLNAGAIVNSDVINCTVVSNGFFGILQIAPGVCRVTNTIVYHDTRNPPTGQFNYSCVPSVSSGPGNITNPPVFQADMIHLAAVSPCRGAGTSVGSGTDLFGQSWASPPSMGCAEWLANPAFELQPILTLTNNPGGFAISFKPSGQEPFSYYWYRDGTLLSDDGHFSGATTTNLTVRKILESDAGQYWVAVSNSFGVVTSQVAPLVIHFVSAAGSSPLPPYTNWSSAATRIQDAIDTAQSGEIVLVTNGVYNTGGKIMSGDLLNRVAIDKQLTVLSVGGYRQTIIEGAWDASTNGPSSIRGVWLTNGATLKGFTVRNGATRGGNSLSYELQCGGGVWAASTNATALNCLLTNNASRWYGGGAFRGVLRNCIVTGNRTDSLSSSGGGGAAGASLFNCSVLNNYVVASFGPTSGAGTYGCHVRNSIVVHNMYITFPLAFPSGEANYNAGSGGVFAGSMAYSCCFPPVSGAGNITAYPDFLDVEFHLPAQSPTRGMGSNLYASGEDMDGEPWANPPSMGADEVIDANLIGPISLALSVAPDTNTLANPLYHYLYFIASLTGHVSRVDWDFGDGVVVTNGNFYPSHSWTNPGSYTVTSTVYNNDNPTGVSASLVINVFPIVAPTLQFGTLDTGGFKFSFPVQAYGIYAVQYATNLIPPITWQTLHLIFPNTNGSTYITDPAWTNAARFYRVMVR